MLGIWERIVHPRKRRRFFDATLFEWLFENLLDESKREEGPWSVIFAISTWWGWKWRCYNVFGERKRCRDRVRFIRDQTKEIVAAYSKAGEKTKPPRVERIIKWRPPGLNWFKLNTDGASRGNPGIATATGVVRDNLGEWFCGFILNIGRCTAALAELWEVYYGLYVAWEKQITRLELEVDSEQVVEFLRVGVGETHPLSFLVRLCHGFLVKDWTVRITHAYKEANRVADGLAQLAFTRPLGFHFLGSAPEGVNLVLREDVDGSGQPRLVPG